MVHGTLSHNIARQNLYSHVDTHHITLKIRHRRLGQTYMMYHHSTSTRTLAALIFFCIGHNLPLIYAQSATRQNCVALPCTYKNECRDKFNTCGGGQLFCNLESLWLPACGGGGSFERPSENDNADANDQNENTTPPPTPLPTLRYTSTPTKRPTNASTLDELPTLLSSQQSSTETPPTLESIASRADTHTAYEGWLSEQNAPKNEIDASTGQEEISNYNPSNTAWFDKAGWDGRREKDENEDTNEALVVRRASCVLGITTIYHLFMMFG